MGWEMRNGRLYYYQKVREGGKVISRYLGRGELAVLIGQFEANSHSVLTAARSFREHEQERAKAKEAELAAYYAEVEAVFQGAMIEAGYHRHKRGEWRKRREQK